MMVSAGKRNYMPNERFLARRIEDWSQKILQLEIKMKKFKKELTKIKKSMAVIKGEQKYTGVLNR